MNNNNISNSNNSSGSGSYRVFSFQSQNFVDTLLEDGLVNVWQWESSCGESKKYALYESLLPDLDSDAVPIFTFLRYNDNCLEYPISAKGLSDNWFSFMRWFRLHGRYLVELEVPKDLGVIGKIEGCEVLDFDCDEKWLEYVLPYVKLEWVREIYKPIQEDCGVTTFEPMINKHEDRLFNSVFKIGRYPKTRRYMACENVDIADYLVNNRPIVGMTYGYNLSRLTHEAERELIEQGMSKHYPESYNDDNLWDANIEKLYSKLYTG